MGKKGKKAQAGKPKKLTPKDIGKRLDAWCRFPVYTPEPVIRLVVAKTFARHATNRIKNP
jgi:hypothetical protein